MAVVTYKICCLVNCSLLFDAKLIAFCLLGSVLLILISVSEVMNNLLETAFLANYLEMILTVGDDHQPCAANRPKCFNFQQFILFCHKCLPTAISF